MTAVAVRGGWGATGWDDPAVGDIGSVRALSARFAFRADDLRALNVELTQGLSGLDGWQGQAAQCFRENQQRLRLGLDSFVERFEKCRTALDTYAQAMDRRHAESDALLSRVLDAQRRLAAAQQDILHPPSVVALSRGLSMQPILIAELERLGADWSGIRGRHMSSAAWCAQQLQDSDGNVLQDLFRDTATTVSTGWKKLRSIQADVGQWLHDNADTIAEVSKVIGDIGTIVQLLAWIPGPQQAVLAPLAVGLAAAAFAGKAIAKASGSTKISTGELVLDGIGVGLSGASLGARAVAGSTYVKVAGSRNVIRLLQAHQVANAARAAGAVDTAWGVSQVGREVISTVAGEKGNISERAARDWPTAESRRSMSDAGVPGPLRDVSTPFWNAVERGQESDALRTGTSR